MRRMCISVTVCGMWCISPSEVREGILLILFNFTMMMSNCCALSLSPFAWGLSIMGVLRRAAEAAARIMLIM